MDRNCCLLSISRIPGRFHKTKGGAKLTIFNNNGQLEIEADLQPHHPFPRVLFRHSDMAIVNQMFEKMVEKLGDGSLKAVREFMGAFFF